MIRGKEREQCLDLMNGLSPICAGLAPEQMEALCDCGEYRECTPGEPIFLQDKPLEIVYLILKGDLLVWRMPYTGSQRLFFARRGAGQIIGEVSGSNPSAVFAGGMQAETECILLGLNHTDYQAAIRGGGQLACNIVYCLSDKIRYAGQRLESLTRHSVQGRIANEIVLLADQCGTTDAQGHIKIKLPRTLTEMAEWLNIEPPTLSRELKILKVDKNIIDYDKGTKALTVLNMPRLKSLCHR